MACMAMILPLSYLNRETVRDRALPAGMVFCDRHYGGINYPVGGVGKIAEALVEGLLERGGRLEYKANVRSSLSEENTSFVQMTSSFLKVYLRPLQFWKKARSFELAYMKC